MWSAERKLALSIKQEIFSRLEELETLFAWICIIFSVAAQFMACRFICCIFRVRAKLVRPEQFALNWRFHF